MDFAPLFDVLGEPGTVALGAALIGLVFGFAAQRSRFCLRSAVIDVTGTASDDGRWHRLTLWALVLGVAIASTQWLVSTGAIDVENVRQFTSARSVSGVLIGGLLFGIGAVLTRGCVSRLTVLAATGNLRAVFALIVFAAAAFATFDGVLTPLRQQLLGLWTLGADTNLNMLSAAGFSATGGILFGAALAVAALIAGLVVGFGIGTSVLGVILGALIAAGWWFSYTLSGQVFEPIAVESISFTRPAIDSIALGSSGFDASQLGFGSGLLGGVLVGSFAAALVSGALKFEWFSSFAHGARFTGGAVLMGIGGVLAGGCSIGAGLTGGALFALAPLLALIAICAGMAATDLALARTTRGTGVRTAQPLPAE